MKSATTFDERLARIAAREGQGPELLAGVCEDSGNKPKVKAPAEKKKRRRGGSGVPLVMTLGLVIAGALYLDVVPEFNIEGLQAQTAALQVQISGYLE